MNKWFAWGVIGLALVWVLTGCNSVPDQGEVDDLKTRVTRLEQSLANTVASIQFLSSQASTSASDIAALQSNANAQQVQLTVIQMGDTIIKMIDPCGATPGFYNEVILRTGSGKLVAYFESGGNRYLTVLPPGNYSTTDGTSCNFSVDSNLKVCYGSTCE